MTQAVQASLRIARGGRPPTITVLALGGGPGLRSTGPTPSRKLVLLMSVTPRVLATALLTSVVLSGVVPAASATEPVTPPVTQQALHQALRPEAQTGPHARDRYVVRYAPGTDVAAEAKGLREKRIKVDREFSKAVRAAVVTLTPAEAVTLADSPRVEAVEVDAVMSVGATQYAAPWGLDRIDQRTLPLSGSFFTAKAGAGVSAYVVDSGVLASHNEFGGRVVGGWSAVTDGLGTGDCNGHGTHVAGTIAGTTFGVAKASTVVPVRVFGCSGSGYTSDVVAGLDWVVGHHVAGVPAVVNMSLGGAASSTVDAALQGVVNDGVTAVVAAGNSAADACTASPARFAAALTVAASDSSDRQAPFSNTGTCVTSTPPGCPSSPPRTPRTRRRSRCPGRPWPPRTRRAPQHSCSVSSPR